MEAESVQSVIYSVIVCTDWHPRLPAYLINTHFNKLRTEYYLTQINYQNRSVMSLSLSRDVLLQYEAIKMTLLQTL